VISAVVHLIDARFDYELPRSVEERHNAALFAVLFLWRVHQQLLSQSPEPNFVFRHVAPKLLPELLLEQRELREGWAVRMSFHLCYPL
jgi:hypothetical protein